MSDQSALMETYKRFPLTIVKGKGSTVWDEQGQEYLDYTSGLAVCNLGHVPNAVQEPVKKQLDTLWHCSNLYHIPVQEQLAALLVEHSCTDHVFFCNSGAEANEAVIKLARRHAQKKKQTDKFEIVTFQQSFHGRTLATLAATGQEKIQDGFAPLTAGFRYLPYNDVKALDELVSNNTIAVLLELVQGEGGVIPADPAWVKQLAQLCQDHDLLFMVDEVQTGMGRTGSLFAYEQYGIEPDVISVAKGLGSGIPIGALLAKQEVASSFDAGSHGSTFGGNPVAATAGKATLEVLTTDGFLVEVSEKAAYLRKELENLQKRYTCIQEVRGLGFLQGLLIKEKAAQVVEDAREQGVLLLLAGPDVVRILPPLTTTKAEMDQVIDVLKNVCQNIE